MIRLLVLVFRFRHPEPPSTRQLSVRAQHDAAYRNLVSSQTTRMWSPCAEGDAL